MITLNAYLIKISIFPFFIVSPFKSAVIIFTNLSTNFEMDRGNFNDYSFSILLDVFKNNINTSYLLILHCNYH